MKKPAAGDKSGRNKLRVNGGEGADDEVKSVVKELIEDNAALKDVMKKPAGSPDEVMKKPAGSNGKTKGTQKEDKKAKPSAMKGRPKRMPAEENASGAAKPVEGDGQHEAEIQYGSRGEELKDPVKAKRFLLLMSRGQLPESVQSSYDEALKLRGDGIQQAKTKIVNRFLVRKVAGG